MPAHVRGLGPGLNPNQLYIQKRRIDNAASLANLSPEDQALMNRADGVVANLPKDGFIQVPELKDPNFNAMLLPVEAAHLPGAWSVLDWNGKMAPDAQAVTPLSGQVTIATGAQPAPLDRDEPIAISLLPQQFQTLAQRVQLKLNGDNNATTISPNEAKNFATTTYMRGLLPEEAQLVPAFIQAVFEAHNKLHAYQSPDTVDVPKLGSATQRLNDAGAQAIVNLKSDTSLNEVHKRGFQSLTLGRGYSAEVTVPAGATGLLINSDTGIETKLPAGTSNLGSLQPGDYLLELWQNNARTDESEFHMPQMSMYESVDLTKNISAKMTAAGAQLNKSFQSTNPAFEVDYDYTTGPGIPVPQGVDLTQTQPLQSSLMPGIYKGTANVQIYQQWNRAYTTVPTPYELEIRPDGVVNLTTNGTKQMLSPQNGSFAGANGQLQGANLTVSSNGGGGSVTIQPSDRAV
jgi:hypothetical protein